MSLQLYNMKLILIFFGCIHFIVASKINCNEIEYNDYKNWDCGMIEYYFTPQEAQKTLYCIDYIKAKSPTYPQRTSLNTTRKIIKFIDVIDDSREIILSEVFKIRYFDNRLAFSNCTDDDFSLKSNGKGKTGDFSDHIWGPRMSLDLYSSIELHTFADAQGMSIKLFPVSLFKSNYIM